MEGSNGEYVFLNTKERVELVQRVSEMAAPDKMIIAGAGCECKNIIIKQDICYASVEEVL